MEYPGPTSVDCPYCERKAGQWCKPTTSRWTLGSVHKSRVKAYFAKLKKQRETVL